MVLCIRHYSDSDTNCWSTHQKPSSRQTLHYTLTNQTVTTVTQSSYFTSPVWQEKSRVKLCKMKAFLHIQWCPKLLAPITMGIAWVQKKKIKCMRKKRDSNERIHSVLAHNKWKFSFYLNEIRQPIILQTTVSTYFDLCVDLPDVLQDYQLKQNKK